MANDENGKNKKVVALKKDTGVTAIVPRNIEEALHLAAELSTSSFVPKSFLNKTGDVLAAIMMGAELGLQPMQALQNIAVINGRPSVWGDALLAIVHNSPSCEYVIEEYDAEKKVATCRAKRRGQPEVVRTFSKADAQTAGLLGKKGPWQNYPVRMLQQRARGFALRDCFPAVLRGMVTIEEAQDYEVIDVTPQKPQKPAKNQKPVKKGVQTTEQGQAPKEGPKDDKVIDVTPEPVKKDEVKQETPQDGAPDVDDFLKPMQLIEDWPTMRAWESENKPLWSSIYKVGTKERKLIEIALSAQKKICTQKSES